MVQVGRTVSVRVDTADVLPDVAFLDPTHEFRKTLRERGDRTCVTLLPCTFGEPDRSIPVVVDLDRECDWTWQVSLP